MSTSVPKHPDGLGDRLDDGDDAGAIESEIDRRPSDVRDLGDQICAAAVDRMGRTELLGEFESAVVHVGRDDLGRARAPRCHDGSQSHRADTNDEDRVAQSWPGLVQHCTRTCGQATGQRAEQFGGHIPGNPDQRVRGRERVGGERRLAEEVAADRLAVPGVRAGAGELALEPASRDQGVPCPQAIPRLPFEAVAALPTRGPADDHFVAHLDLGDSRTDLLDDAGSLMAEDCRERHAHVTRPRDRVGVADAGGHDAYQRLPATGRFQLDLLPGERSVLLLHDERLDLHAVSSDPVWSHVGDQRYSNTAHVTISAFGTAPSSKP